MVVIMKIQLGHSFEEIISIENLLEAWKEFLVGKRNKSDVQEFAFNLFDNILQLHEELASKKYIHGSYHCFNICDPKPRIIHKASVRDRLLHHAIYRVLYPFFDRTFAPDSFSCRIGKGTHRAINRFRSFAYEVSKNHTRTCWVLKCDIRKFFHSIDHGILMEILSSYIADQDIIWLLKRIIESFNTIPGKGLPLGNLTSQLFANVYMNKLDQFVKHSIKAKQYVRYADDFVVLSDNRQWLETVVTVIEKFLHNELKLSFHPDKISIGAFASGVDFLGWVHFSDHRVLRTATKNRMLKRIIEKTKKETVQSYLGLLSHGNTNKLKKIVVNL